LNYYLLNRRKVICLRKLHWVIDQCKEHYHVSILDKGSAVDFAAGVAGVDSPGLATTRVVSQANQFALLSTDRATGALNVADQSSRLATSFGGGSASEIDSLAPLRVCPGTATLSESAILFISNSIRDSTKKSYASCWKRWTRECAKGQWNPLDPTEHQVVIYLASLLDAGLASASVMIHKSAIWTCLGLRDIKFLQLLDSDLIKRVLNGGFNSSPIVRKSSVWDLNQVPECFESRGPNDRVSMGKLFKKTLMIVSLVTPCRVLELAASSRDFVVYDTGWILNFDKLKENSTVKRNNLQLEISAFPNRKLCPLACLKTYVERTKNADTMSLFVTLSRPFRRPKPNTLAKHLKSFGNGGN
jgi:hypothetical protein